MKKKKLFLLHAAMLFSFSLFATNQTLSNNSYGRAG
jgi:hypothetical protein